MKTIVHTLILGLTMVSGSAHAHADPLLAQSLAECARVTSATERLDCYDQLSRDQTPDPTPDQAPPSDVAPLVSRPPPLPAAATVATPPPPPIAPAAPVAPATSVEKQTKRQSSDDWAMAEPVREETELRARIVEVEKLRRGNFRLTLDNGEVWQENEYDRFTRYAVGDVIVIKPALFETFNLTSEATKRRNKVKRIK